MTPSQSKMFTEIIDLNWEFKQEEDVLKKFSIAKELSKKKQELREDMGHEAYDTFMENGRKMFASK